MSLRSRCTGSYIKKRVFRENEKKRRRKVITMNILISQLPPVKLFDNILNSITLHQIWWGENRQCYEYIHYYVLYMEHLIPSSKRYNINSTGRGNAYHSNQILLLCLYHMNFAIHSFRQNNHTDWPNLWHRKRADYI